MTYFEWMRSLSDEEMTRLLVKAFVRGAEMSNLSFEATKTEIENIVAELYIAYQNEREDLDKEESDGKD